MATAAPDVKPAVVEMPPSMGKESQLLDSFLRVPMLGKATLRPGATGMGVHATVRFRLPCWVVGGWSVPTVECSWG